MRKFVKSILTMFMVGSIGLSTTMVNAASPAVTTATIDDSQKGSITLVKYAEPEGKWIEANGLDSDKLPDAMPIQGVEFMEYKVADIGTYLFNGEIGTYYTNLTSEFKTFMNSYNLTPDKVDGDGNAYYTADTLQHYLSLANNKQIEVEQFVKTNGTAFSKTNQNGSTSMNNLDLGLYLVAETDVKDARVANSWLTGDDTYLKLTGLNSQNTDKSNVKDFGDDGDLYASNVDSTKVSIASKTRPYFISVPTTNTAKIGDNEPGTVWQYDITSYPKNSITDITKMLVDQDDNKTLRAYEDYEIGDTVKQVIFSGVQGLRDGKKHEYYKITDNMTAGLKFDKITSVTCGKRTKNPTSIDDFSSFTAFTTEDYSLTTSNNNHSFELAFTDKGLAKLDTLKDDYLIVVSFNATLTNDAVIGPKDDTTSGQNMNQPTLTWKNTGEPQFDIVGNKVYAFTYGIDITKDGLDDLTKATFKIQRADKTQTTDTKIKGDEVDVQFIKEQDGIYHIFDKVNDDPDKIVTAINPNAQGKLYVKGVDSKQYVVVEVSTEKGKNLLTHAFALTLIAPNKNTSNIDGNITSNATTLDSNGTITKTIPLLTDKGIAYITIHNNDVVALHTGGNGNSMFYIISALLVVVALGGVIVYKKRKTSN